MLLPTHQGLKVLKTQQKRMIVNSNLKYGTSNTSRIKNVQNPIKEDDTSSNPKFPYNHNKSRENIQQQVNNSTMFHFGQQNCIKSSSLTPTRITQTSWA